MTEQRPTSMPPDHLQALYELLQTSGVSEVVLTMAALIRKTRSSTERQAVRGHLMRMEQELERCAEVLAEHERLAIEQSSSGAGNGKRAAGEDEAAPTDPWSGKGPKW